MMGKLIKQTKVSLPMLIEGAENEAKDLKLQTRLLRKYAQKIGK